MWEAVKNLKLFCVCEILIVENGPRDRRPRTSIIVLCSGTGRACCVTMLYTTSNLVNTHESPAYRSKRRSITARSAILLQDNACHHNAHLTLGTIPELRWEVLKYSPYSLNLSPCDYHMFAQLKADGGQRFNNDNEVEKLCAHGCPSCFRKGGRNA